MATNKWRSKDNIRKSYSPSEISDPDKDCQLILKSCMKYYWKKYTHTVWKHDTTDYLIIVKGKINIAFIRERSCGHYYPCNQTYHL